MKYKYTGKPFKGQPIEKLSQNTIDILVAWGYITKEKEDNNESKKSQPVEPKARKKQAPIAKSDSELDSRAS